MFLKLSVCRALRTDLITLCRAMNIPARHCNCDLGDIGVPAVDGPMDFSAWLEAFLGDRWYTFDARYNTPRIGRVVIARGRQAADVVMTSSLGEATLRVLTVICGEISSDAKFRLAA